MSVTDVAALSNEQVGEKIDQLVASANALTEGIQGSTDPEAIKAVTEEMQALQAQVAPLMEEQRHRLMQESIKSLTGSVKDVETVVRELRNAYSVPDLGGLGTAEGPEGVYQDGAKSLFGDIRLSHEAGKASVEARERLEDFFGGKAMTEGTDSAGGYLVRPEYLGELYPRVRRDNLSGIVPKVRVRTDKIEFVSVGEGLSAGWTAELAAKPLGADLSFSMLEASIFTVAGLAVASNQLLEDSSIDRLIVAELEKRVHNVIELAILAGSGTGQPLGMLNTPGIQDQLYDDASPTVGELLVQIAQAIAKVQDNHLSEPTHIIMRPQTWTAIITSADAEGKFTFGAGVNDPGQRTARDAFPGRALFGYPVILTGSMPSNLAADHTATGNQTRVIVADMSEQLMMVRSELQVDKSEHVYFTSNQTVFRGERRLGFTAARYPKSIVRVYGTGLINTFA